MMTKTFDSVNFWIFRYTSLHEYLLLTIFLFRCEELDKLISLRDKQVSVVDCNCDIKMPVLPDLMIIHSVTVICFGWDYQKKHIVIVIFLMSQLNAITDFCNSWKDI